MIDPSTDIPTSSSSDTEWINWFNDLDSAVGTSDAKTLFIKAWKYRGSSSANTNALRTFFAGYNITIDGSVFDSVVDAGDSFIDTIGGVFNFGKYATYAVVGIVVVTVGITLFSIARHSSSLASQAITRS